MRHKTTSPLRNLRRARTLSQVEMARVLSVSQQTVAKFETGRLLPSVDVQARIAAILGVAREELFPAPAEQSNRKAS